MKKKDIKHKINEHINYGEVRLVGDNVNTGINGVYKIEEALKLAENNGLDLVLVNDTAKPVICKLLNYDKFLYETTKTKKPQKSKPLKEVNFSLNIGEHDIEFKVNNIKNFLSKGHKVKITLQFKGREITFKNRGMEILLKIAVDLEEFGTPDSLPVLSDKKLIMFINPISK